MKNKKKYKEIFHYIFFLRKIGPKFCSYQFQINVRTGLVKLTKDISIIIIVLVNIKRRK